MTESAREPTSAARPDGVMAGDTPPPPPPHELAPDPPFAIQFTARGEDWIARVSGKGACGTGSYGLGMIDAVHFCRADAPEQPVREALLARGRFEGLHETELCALLAGSVAIVEPDAG